MAKSAFEINGENRSSSGRTDSRRIRKAGKVPAIVYGGGEEPRSVVLDHNSLSHQMNREAFYTSILTLNVGGSAQQVVVKAVQRHPVRPQIMHLDFQRVREDQEITLNVPIHFLNEANAKGVKDQGGVVDRLLTDTEVTCLPRHLPEYLEIDVIESRAQRNPAPVRHQVAGRRDARRAAARSGPPGRRCKSAAPRGRGHPGRRRGRGGRWRSAGSRTSRACRRRRRAGSRRKRQRTGKRKREEEIGKRGQARGQARCLTPA